MTIGAVADRKWGFLWGMNLRTEKFQSIRDLLAQDSRRSLALGTTKLFNDEPFLNGSARTVLIASFF
jgi:hypothetical protein